MASCILGGCCENKITPIKVYIDSFVMLIRILS